MTSASALVRFQIGQADHIDFHAVYLHNFATRITILKVDSIDRAENFQPDRRYSHAHNMLGFLKKGLVQFRNIKPELAQRFHEPVGIFVVIRNPNIEIGSRARKSVMSDCVSTDEQILNPRRAQQS